MSFFDAIAVSASGLTAQRLRMDVISNNLANADTTRTPEGGPYRRQLAVFAERRRPLAGFPSGPARPFEVAFLDARAAVGLAPQEAPDSGVRVVGIVRDASPLPRRYDPGHPDADADGYVTESNVDILREMVDLMGASRAYEANVTALNLAKELARRTLELGRA